MDDKTPTPDQTPESTPDARTVPVTPDPESAAPTVGDGQHPAFPAADPVGAPARSAPTSGRTRALLIGGGIAAAVILAGGGIAVGAAISDEFDDDHRPSISDDGRHDDHHDDGRHEEHRGEHDDARMNDRGPATGIGAASAEDLIDIAEAARSAADGEVTSIDAKRDGTWEVQLTASDGSESEVRVTEDLVASVIATDAADDDDTGPALTLDDATIRALVAAAFEEAEGTITDLDVDGDDTSPYDASILTSDNRSIDIDFSADFAVVGTDLD
ncbi:hypothetical protein [Microbacterium aurugineum]|uniref:hypothetical protein n=1 Tax=Microbacterium aurugineum TaxID=2851642 RepID=UPI0020BD5200|nr:hypothetical protein [Microbacterium aurugineum]MCK8475665.1 hypothetical protein [Microbacterium aurugineum]